MSRYVVTEIEGYRIDGRLSRAGAKTAPGLTCQVIDTARNHALVAMFASEDQGTSSHVSRATRYARAREQAAALANRLNAGVASRPC